MPEPGTESSSCFSCGGRPGISSASARRDSPTMSEIPKSAMPMALTMLSFIGSSFETRESTSQRRFIGASPMTTILLVR